MDKPAFEAAFETLFAAPLEAAGFFRPRGGRSLFWREDGRELAILRLTRKSPRAGEVNTLVCFRHSCLRAVSSDDRNPPRLIPADYPWQLTFADFDHWPHQPPVYQFRLNGRAPVRLHPGDMTEAEIHARLRAWTGCITHRVLPWARTRTLTGERDTLRALPSPVWCEARWLEDYEAALS
ncbi:hypothetical protein [Vannielia sp. SX4]|uniref:hypothetical protein n=1 Tax=Vannielia sp. SX4 TaxID=3463852 RepID=UPI004057F87B